ncbi:tetratricopeptide repeat protein [Arcticibacter pallidicorallinus]|uniref:Tetratricopeptide repeat protein n=1 Tax=Arcticibacter pallidicorallinus TaxID=1259464 RepID=A0A2T0TRK9_9SPHI|nr:tetratricopeptide repeat protein [Arcticibacter pallidicorallinus]PRY48352.1 tetratricopeptide repeat protein [Arcticibacter pallidicorallinus]
MIYLVKNFYWIVILILLPLRTISQVNDNAELKKMHDEDQNARRVSKIDWTQLDSVDSLHRSRVYELINQGAILTRKDYYHSAMIFQHGKDSVAYGMAVKHMRKAIELDSTISKWLLAAAIDRELMSRNKPQIYGTQYVKRSLEGKWENWEMDTTKVTDEERRYYQVPTLSEQKELLRNWNLPTVAEYHRKSANIDETVSLIKIEKTKGKKSAYNVSESSINDFGYELMSSGKLADALKVFLANTELYPAGFNTWDSLGECLLKLDRKEEGLAAYRKSVSLSPGNKNAVKVLAEHQ